MGAFGGRRDIMECVAPLGPVYQAGTLSGNPLAVTAGLATLRLLDELDVYPQIEKAANRLAIGLSELSVSAGIPTVTNGVGSMMTLFFHSGSEVRDWQTASQSDTKRYAAFFHHMLDRGVYLAPSQYESAFVGLAHTDDIVDRTLTAAAEGFAAIGA